MSVTGRSVKRALAAGVVLAALVPALAGCSAGEADLESQLSELPGVAGAYVWTTTSGVPTNRGFAVRLYVGEAPPDDLTGLLDDAFRMTWTHSAFKPSNGISLEVSAGDRPDKPEPGGWGEERVEVGDAANSIPWGDGYLEQRGVSTSASASRWALESRYGEWSDDR